jgi:hypothetical protein
MLLGCSFWLSLAAAASSANNARPNFVFVSQSAGLFLLRGCDSWVSLR